MPTCAITVTTTITFVLEWEQFKNLKPEASQYPLHIFYINVHFLHFYINEHSWILIKI